MAEIIRGIEFRKESPTHEKRSETMSKQRKEWKKRKRLRSTRNVARDISAEITRKINTTMFHNKNLKRENPYYSALLNTMVNQRMLSKYNGKTLPRVVSG